MSFAVIHGEPKSCQIYLDEVMKTSEEDGKNLGSILLDCMRRNPNHVMMINASTSKSFTNSDLLPLISRVARAIEGQEEMVGRRGRALVVMANHETLIVVYCGLLVAGWVPLMMDPNSTVYELKHFMELQEPDLIFCDPHRVVDIVAVLRESKQKTVTVACGDNCEIKDAVCLRDFIDGISGDWKSLKAKPVSAADEVLMMPTSGSTGLPKASVLTNQGIIAQIPCSWYNYETFPKPEERIMLLSTAQWMTHTLIVMSSIVYRMQLIVTPQKITADSLVNIIQNFSPTWTLMSPATASMLATSAQRNQVMTLKTVLMTGSTPSQNIINMLKNILPEDAQVLNGYGMTETHGFISIPNPKSPQGSIGKIMNTFFYKIINDDGREIAEVKQRGELLLKSPTNILKAYYKNATEYNEIVAPDGWLKTGDTVYRDEEENIFYVEKKKFAFKYNNHHISPEEVEKMIYLAETVKQCVVCMASEGPAALVVLVTGADEEETRRKIREIIDASLSDHKRLRGGIAVVSSLPCTHSGKIMRRACQDILTKLVEEGRCF